MSSTLFPSVARQQFVDVTGQRYQSMRARLAKKNLAVPFTVEQLRTHVLYEFMGGTFAGAIQCRYCFAVIGIEDSAFDHAVPLARGGSPALTNISVICKNCNDQKGEMLPEEFHALRAFLHKELPLARVDILQRLQMHSKLMAGKRMNEALQYKSSGPPRPKSGKPPLIHAIDKAF